MTGTWIERARIRMDELGLTQSDLMAPLGVKTRGAVGHYMTGRREPSIAQFSALAKILDVTIDNLLEGLGSNSVETIPDLPTLADRIRWMRKKCGLSQEALAKASGLTQQSLAALEQGKAKATSRLVQLANAIGVDPMWLAEGVDANAPLVSFHERLASALEKANPPPWSSSAELARRLGVSAPTVHGWVHGDYLPTPENARKIAELLGIEFDWLYFGKGTGQARPAGDSRPLHLALEEIANRPSMKMTSREFVELVREKAAQIERYS